MEGVVHQVHNEPVLQTHDQQQKQQNQAPIPNGNQGIIPNASSSKLNHGVQVHGSSSSSPFLGQHDQDVVRVWTDIGLMDPVPTYQLGPNIEPTTNNVLAQSEIPIQHQNFQTLIPSPLLIIFNPTDPFLLHIHIPHQHLSHHQSIPIMILII
ncbi:hypothetical protein FRX31_029052 [Thalictrum thalictroides]|uniref:Uncharacterized protein n=1 Tax=Thalictrum thalictroides TaxID=46969 RepID=A0A7J6V9L3_THATH|nr:hypothetical protein FRX31_029052 [Thalictrum thalictroides]